MLLDFFSIYHFLSAVLLLSIADDNAQDLLTALQRKHCGYTPYCNADTTTQDNLFVDSNTNFFIWNTTSSSSPIVSTWPIIDKRLTSSSDVRERSQCCFQCSCSETCGQYGNCCIDKYVQGEEKITLRLRDRQSQNGDANKGTRFTCLTPQLSTSTNLFGISKAISYNMIDTCPANSLGNRQISKCTSDHRFGDFLTDVTPVYVKNKNIMYKNVHCLSCNFENINKAISLDPVLLCPKHIIPKLMAFDTPSEIIDFLQGTPSEIIDFLQGTPSEIIDFDFLRQAEKPPCNLMFKFPRNMGLSNEHYNSHVCMYPEVRVCNITGRWVNFDPVVVEACENYYLPVKVTLQGDTVPTTFRNLACYECNFNTVETTLQCDAPLEMADVELRLHVASSVSKFKSPITVDIPSGTSEKKKPCEIGQFFDIHKDKCRDIACPLGKYRLNGKCVPIFKESTSLHYNVVVKTYVTQGDLERFLDDFDKNSNLITDLLSNFNHEHLNVTIQSVWIKANQQHPMIVFNLTLTQYDIPLIYNSLLKTLRFLQSDDAKRTVRKHEFVFADHIHFNKGGAIAVDLIDKVEMYNLKYPVIDNKKNNLFSLEMTEMRLCDRVKVKKIEYNITDNETLYLKHAKVTFYGNEYFVDRKNHTYVCLNKYNNKQSHTLDGLSDTHEIVVKENQGDNSEKDIMRDFGFFIGCLALLMLFVAVALAKKNYLNKRLQEMRAASDSASSVKDNSENAASDENVR